MHRTTHAANRHAPTGRFSWPLTELLPAKALVQLHALRERLLLDGQPDHRDRMPLPHPTRRLRAEVAA